MTVADYHWTSNNDERVRPEHAARWPRSPWSWPYRLPDLERLNVEQREQWAAFVRARRLRKRMRRAQRTMAPDWRNDLLGFVLELQRDPAAVLLTSGCRCPACCAHAATHHPLRDPNRDLTRGPRRLTRAQRKLRHKAQP